MKAKLTLVNLAGSGTYTFARFPGSITTTSRAAWESQKTTIGTHPLLYGGREPRRIVFNDLLLDQSYPPPQSIKPQIDGLLALQRETRRGAPPPLLAIWGDRQERVVLEEVEIEEIAFTRDNKPYRARVRVTLLEVQRVESSTVTVQEEFPDLPPAPSPPPSQQSPPPPLP